MEKLTKEIQILATQILQGVNGDADKATEGVKAINNILVQNPKLIPFIADENNRKEFESIKLPKKGGLMAYAGVFTQLQKLSTKFNKGK